MSLGVFQYSGCSFHSRSFGFGGTLTRLKWTLFPLGLCESSRMMATGSTRSRQYYWNSDPRLHWTMMGKHWLSFDYQCRLCISARIWNFTFSYHTTVNHRRLNDNLPLTSCRICRTISTTLQSFILSCNRFTVDWLSFTRFSRHSQCNKHDVRHCTTTHLLDDIIIFRRIRGSFVFNKYGSELLHEQAHKRYAFSWSFSIRRQSTNVLFNLPYDILHTSFYLVTRFDGLLKIHTKDPLKVFSVNLSTISSTILSSPT